MALDVVGVVEGKILRPVAWLRQVQDGPQKRWIVRALFQLGDLYFRPVR